MRVAACLVTRGNVPMDDIVESIPEAWEVVIWDNSKLGDFEVYGRYEAITMTDAEVIYVQDDDCVLDPESFDTLLAAYEPGKIVANMPERFRHDFYTDHCLVGFGALFDRSLVARAMHRFQEQQIDLPSFHRTCDVIFTALTPYVLVDVGYRDQPWASDPDRMWKQSTHVAERQHALEIARQVRSVQ